MTIIVPPGGYQCTTYLLAPSSPVESPRPKGGPIDLMLGAPRKPQEFRMASSNSSLQSESEATDTKWNFVDPNKEVDTESTVTENTIDIDATLPKNQGTPEEARARYWRV